MAIEQAVFHFHWAVTFQVAGQRVVALDVKDVAALHSLLAAFDVKQPLPANLHLTGPAKASRDD